MTACARGILAPMESQVRLAIVIVNWNTRDLTLECLRSIHEELPRTPAQVEVWVTDNASTDASPAAIRAAFPSVRLIESAENLGFARGNNLALRALGFPDGANTPDYVLLLNPDTLVRAGALAALIEGMRASGAGLAGARLVYAGGSFQHSAFVFPGLFQLAIDLFPLLGRFAESPANGRYPRSRYEAGQPFEIDFPLGASFMLSRAAIQQSGLFDEDFFLYCEEIDWAMRIRQAGFRAVCIPAAEVLHYGGQSTVQVKPQSIINLWKARLQLYRKHYPAWKRIAAKLLLRAGMNQALRRNMRDSSLPEPLATELFRAYREVIQMSYRL